MVDDSKEDRLGQLRSRPGAAARIAAICAEMEWEGLTDAERAKVGQDITDEINADPAEVARLRASMEQAEDPSRRHPWVYDES